jgi:hypothetical protein
MAQPARLKTRSCLLLSPTPRAQESVIASIPGFRFRFSLGFTSACSAGSLCIPVHLQSRVINYQGQISLDRVSITSKTEAPPLSPATRRHPRLPLLQSRATSNRT